jgi:translation initiation factor 2 subunit 2
MADDQEVTSTTEKLDELQVDDDADLLNLGEKKKKKKKKQTTGDADAALAEATEAAPADDDDAVALDLNLTKKKKKKKNREARTDSEFAGELDGDAAADDGAAEQQGTGLPWEGSDRDYSYQELLDRVFGILREHNPELTGEKRRTIMKPPQVAREGTKKTVFTNYAELCKAMNRQPEHVQLFLLAELGTSGSVDGQQRLIVKGRFQPKAFEGVLRRYVNEYVLCNSCKSPDTLLDRDSATRIMFLRCQQCGASRTVAPIKAGFVARTSRRKVTGP